MGKLREKIAGEPQKEVSGFQYVQGSICRVERDDDGPVRPISTEAVEKGEGTCPRDDGEFKKQKDGRVICEKCGLALTAAVKEKYGIKI